MKRLILISFIFLNGCAISLTRLPTPVEADVAGALRQHAEALDLLVADYNERHPKVAEKKTEKK